MSKRNKKGQWITDDKKTEFMRLTKKEKQKILKERENNDKH